MLIPEVSIRTEFPGSFFLGKMKTAMGMDKFKKVKVQIWAKYGQYKSNK